MGVFSNAVIRMMAAGFVASTLASAPAVAQQYVGSVTPSGDQDIVIYRGGGMTSSDGRFSFQFQQDGNLVLYQGTRVLWSSKTTPKYGTVNTPIPVTFVSHACVLRFQTDGNLVVYGADGVVGAVVHPCDNPNFTKENAPVHWRSKTDRNPFSTLKVQDDGNVVIYNSSNRAIWSTKTCCR